MRSGWRLGFLTFLVLFSTAPGPAQAPQGAELDRRVTAFLDKMDRQWRDMNVPRADGKVLYDIVAKNNYRRGLEIGTSTGHSAIWIAWAMSKTGGKLVTLEVDERRYRQALANFKEAGVADYIDARLADAHELTPQLEGPWDFVFIDADKEWYTNYAKAVIPKLAAGGCIAAHNIPQPGAGRRGGMRGTAEYYEYMLALPEFATSMVRESQGGISVSYKKKAP